MKRTYELRTNNRAAIRAIKYVRDDGLANWLPCTAQELANTELMSDASI
jgi:hypothetical protein